MCGVRAPGRWFVCVDARLRWGRVKWLATRLQLLRIAKHCRSLSGSKTNNASRSSYTLHAVLQACRPRLIIPTKAEQASDATGQ